MEQQSKVQKEKKLYKVAMIGSGKYAIAMTAVMQDNTNHDAVIKIWCRKQEKCDEINQQRMLKEVSSLVKFKDCVSSTTSVEECVKDVDFIFLCIPAQTLSTWLHENAKHFPANATFVNCAKGMSIVEKKFISQIFASIFPDRVSSYCVLSGPSFADEIFKKMPSCVTIAGTDPKRVDDLQNVVTSPYFKSYWVSDVLGVELCGSLKNVLALGSGFVDGLNFASNTMAAFVSRGVKEIQILVKHFGADPNTVLGLAGIGDIMMCCYGNLSRNRLCGLRVAKGEKLDEVIKSIGTVEGVPTVSVLYEVIKESNLQSKVMLISGIHDLIYGKIGVKEGMEMIMENRKHHEFEHLI